MEHLYRRGDYTLYGLSNAITEMSQTVDDYGAFAAGRSGVQSPEYVENTVEAHECGKRGDRYSSIDTK